MCGDGCVEVVPQQATLTIGVFDPEFSEGSWSCPDVCPDRTGDCPEVCETGIGACSRLTVLGVFSDEPK